MNARRTRDHTYHLPERYRAAPAAPHCTARLPASPPRSAPTLRIAGFDGQQEHASTR